MSRSQLQNNSYDVHFAFGDAGSIGVPLSELVLDAGAGACFLGVAALPDSQVGTASLGLDFLRFAYVVLDQTLDKVSLEQYVNCGQNEQEIPSSGAAGLGGKCQVSTTSAMFPPSSTASLTSSPSKTLATAGDSSTGNTSPGLSSGAKVGIAVGVSAFGVAAAGLITSILLRYARRKRAAAARNTRGGHE